jgi:hypothetical protein
MHCKPNASDQGDLMNIPSVLAICVELLREEVLSLRIMRLSVGQARIATQLRELLSLVEPTIELKHAEENVRCACCELYHALKRDGLPGIMETDHIRERRKRALRTIDELERSLSSTVLRDGARDLGLTRSDRETSW